MHLFGCQWYIIHDKATLQNVPFYLYKQYRGILTFDTVNAVRIVVHEPNMACHWMFDMSNTTDVTSGTCRNSILFRSTYCGIRVVQYLVVCVVLCESLFFSFLSFAHCIIFSYLIYGLWLTLLYLQNILLLIFIISLITIFVLTWILRKHTTVCETVFKKESMENNRR